MRSYGTGVAGITSPATLAFGTITTICSDAGNNCAVIAANQPHVTSLSSCLPASVVLPSETLDGSIHRLSQQMNDKQMIVHVFEFTPGKIEYHIQELLWWSKPRKNKKLPPYTIIKSAFIMYFESKGIWGATHATLITSLPMQHSLEQTLMNDGIYLNLNNTQFLIFIKKMVDGLYNQRTTCDYCTLWYHCMV